jgi:SAM-dependent methyltransferase
LYDEDELESTLYDEYVRIEDTHWWFRGRREIVRALIRPHLQAPAEIIDVGSGGGAVAEALMEFGQVTACDVDVRCAASVERRPGMKFAYGTAEAVPFPDGSFDLVTAFEVLEHLDDDVRALKEMGRLAKPGGLVAVTVPAYKWLWGRQDEVSHHQRRYSRRSLASAFEGAGLRVIRLTAFNTFLFPGIAAVRLARRLTSRGRRPDPSTLKSDFSMTKPGPFNDLLGIVFMSEARLLGKVNLPVGVSLFALARRD